MTNSRKELRHARTTPLASIFGSGFLVIVPILAATVGPYSVVATAGAPALAYAMGSVIRFNIRHAEPLFAEGTASDRATRHEQTANFALVLAYAISVCLSIHILAGFVLGGLGINTPFRENIVCVVIIAAIVRRGDSAGSICSWSWQVGHYGSPDCSFCAWRVLSRTTAHPSERLADEHQMPGPPETPRRPTESRRQQWQQ